MKFGKLDLNKQSVARLTQDETLKVIGGAEKKRTRGISKCRRSTCYYCCPKDRHSDEEAKAHPYKGD